jgi:hypothetical protein
MAERALKLTIEPLGRNHFALLIQRVGDTEATDALIRVFYHVEINGSPGLLSDFDVVPLMEGAATVTKTFAIPPEIVAFVRAELLRAVGRGDHRPGDPA